MVSLHGSTVSLQCDLKRINHTFDWAASLSLIYFSQLLLLCKAFQVCQRKYNQKEGGPFYFYVSEEMRVAKMVFGKSSNTSWL